MITSRRRLLAVACALGASVAPLPVRAQRVPRIGVLGIFAPESTPLAGESLRQFNDELRVRGWGEGGRRYEVVARFVQGQPARAAALAEELLSAAVDVIVTVGDTLTEVARKATQTVPIVMAYSTLPVELGHVASLARPGGNVTGVSANVWGMIGKHLELMRAMRPDLKKTALVWQRGLPIMPLAVQEHEAMASRFGVQLLLLPVDGVEGLGDALVAAREAGVQALSLAGNVGFYRRKPPVSAWAIEHKVMVMGPPEEGYLMNYWPEVPLLFRMAAGYVDRILRGAKPADLPVEQPNVYRFVINLRTARAMALTVPAALIARADEVIE